MMIYFHVDVIQIEIESSWVDWIGKLLRGDVRYWNGSSGVAILDWWQYKLIVFRNDVELIGLD